MNTRSVWILFLCHKMLNYICFKYSALIIQILSFTRWNRLIWKIKVSTMWYTYLLVIKSSWCIKRLNYRCSVSKEKRVACSTTEHAQDCKPRVCHILWRETTIPYAKHMWQSFEQSPRILGPPWSILKFKKIYIKLWTINIDILKIIKRLIQRMSIEHWSCSYVHIQSKCLLSFKNRYLRSSF